MSTRVLIVDDNEDSRNILLMILSMHGFEGIEARDGNDALEQARAFKPAVIVTDIFMPGLDGIDLTRRLRDDRELAGIPVVAQTAYVNAIETHRDLFAAVLEKPCQPSELLATLDALGITAEAT
ncbi:MAG TPA: response regulator [Steroidobacteraceae bacterium]